MVKTKPSRPRPSAARLAFLPPVAQWFRNTFAAPSPAQVLAWPAIRRGENTLLLAPTGSGKTLAAFLCAIDNLYRRLKKDPSLQGIQVLYITPLKALGNDIQKNLLGPLAEIHQVSGGTLPEIRVAVRTGDTPQEERARMVRRPPHILITTPESLYLLLGSGSMSDALRRVRTVIVDEVHALCDSKRGVHLAVSLERLAAQVSGPLQRVGCSATIRPLEEVAAFLVGYETDGTQRPCTILDVGRRKQLDVHARAPLPDFLEASYRALWSSAYALLLEEIARHRTTLIFCNSRYKAERTVLRLRELSEDGAKIGVHHGSMSKELRLEAEEKLKSGQLQALVATASLELGIDIGSIDLVYQLESPKSVATALQRIGRAGHLLEATSKGRVLLFGRDELAEAAAICRGMREGTLDALTLPRGCLDVLAQQIAGAVAAGEGQAEELYALLRHAYPYTDLTQEQYESVLAMLAGEFPFEMSRPPKPLLLWDRASGRLTPTRGAAHVTAMCVGTIPEGSEYDVVVASTRRKVGSMQSEFVDDSLREGDVFVLGSTSWRVQGMQRNKLLVEEAPGSTPTVPWWLGPIAPRTAEVGQQVGALRREIATRLSDPALPTVLQEEYSLCHDASEALIEYVREQHLACGLVPDHHTLLVEVWRDELGRWNLILHCPFGQRINRTWGTALTMAATRLWKQHWSATASNDLLLLTRTGPESARDLPIDASALFAAVTPETVSEFLAESASTVVSFGTAFREAATCGLQVLRAWRGARVPLWLQNYRANELFEAARRALTYPVTAEVLREYHAQVLDASGVKNILQQVRAGEIQLTYQQVTAPSPFAHSLLIGDAFSSDYSMARDRRAHLLRLHRQVLQEVLTEEQLAELLDPRAIETLEFRLSHRSEATRARTSDELAQAIRDLGDLPATLEAIGEVCEGDPATLLLPLLNAHRVVATRVPEDETDSARWVAADLWREYHDAFARSAHSGPPLLVAKVKNKQITGFSAVAPPTVIPARWRKKRDRETARRALVARYLKCRGPVTVYEIANHTGWPVPTVEMLLDGLVTEGVAARGVYTRAKPRPQWVNKANLEEIHRRTLGYLKRELAACAPRECVDFITRWQHRHPATHLHGLDGLRAVIQQLQGLEVMQGALETEILPGRVADYSPAMLDQLIASGEVCWRRLHPRHLKRGSITLCFRRDTEWLARGALVEFDGLSKADVDIPEVIADVRSYLQEHHTAFFMDMVAATGHLEGAVQRALWHLAWCGEITCDTYECLRHADLTISLSACYDLDSTPVKIVRGRMTADRIYKQMQRKRLDPRLGRWYATERLAPPKPLLAEAEVAARWAQQLLDRWGIVTREFVEAEGAAPEWSALVREFKRRELLGQVHRGYFIESHHGEQYGLPEAIELLRECRARRGEESGYLPDEPVYAMTNRDPANLYCSCLEVTDERGEIFARHLRSGNLHHRLVAQAGQVLIYNSTQLVTLTRAQLTRCMQTLQYYPSGQMAEVGFGSWNKYPIGASPIAGLLYELGFRTENHRMCWPSKRKAPRPTSPIPDTFLPHWAEPEPEQYGPEWVIEQASEQVRPLLAEVLPKLCVLLEGPEWNVRWEVPNSWARYRGLSRVWIRMVKTYFEVILWTPFLRVDGKKQNFRRQIRFTPQEGVTPETMTRLQEALQMLIERTDQHVTRAD